jgi:DNA-directed RNA polymerase subunit RPC12/RpoP
VGEEILSNLKKVNCPRCGKEVMTTVKSPIGDEKLKSKYEGHLL